MSAASATREAQLFSGLITVSLTPKVFKRWNRLRFDGEAEVASFPGDLPEDPAVLFDAAAFKGLTAAPPDATDFRFLRFRPPRTEQGPWGDSTLPHIRLDRALQFLIGDRLA